MSSRTAPWLLALSIPFLQQVALADPPVASAAPAAPAASAAPASPTAARDRFAGNYTYAGGDKQRAAYDAAVEKGIEGIFFAVRPIARGKVKDKTEIKTAIGFAFANGQITSIANGEAPAASKDDGTPMPFKHAGENVKLSQKITGDGHLLQTFSSADGTRVNDYVLSADGKMLTVGVTITASKLTNPVKYTLTYRRN